MLDVRGRSNLTSFASSCLGLRSAVRLVLIINHPCPKMGAAAARGSHCDEVLLFYIFYFSSTVATVDEPVNATRF